MVKILVHQRTKTNYLSKEKVNYMKIPYCDNNGGNLSVIVRLRHAANVYLVDETNLHLKQSGQNFKYYGGYYTKTPVRITVSDLGRWYLIVENSNESYQFSWSK